MKLRGAFTLLGLIAFIFSIGQTSAPPENWFNLDPAKDGVYGISAEKMYKTLLTNLNSKTVVVAVIDSGVDPDHEDLSEVMWVNEDEIADNGVDDDKNGYIDDVHGWNFIGGENGENVHHDTYEETRLYKKLKPKYENASPDKLNKKGKAEYKLYKEVEKAFSEKLNQFKQQNMQVALITSAIEQVRAYFGEEKEVITGKDIMSIDPGENQKLGQAKGMLAGILGEEGELAQFEKQVTQAANYFENSLNYGYNLDFDPRNIVGDDYNNLDQKIYGNNDIQGPDASHGTHVAGIIAAIRDNDVGMKGVANNVRIMALRAVPDGDERDKDVANAIRYAVDNGAKIINMSFGKKYAWDKPVVDAAVKYARKNDVLLVHAAGNDSYNIDEIANFPNDKFAKKGLFGKKNADNWIEVGALNWVGGENLAAGFSNFGKDNVDLFAPGVDVYSTIPDNGYDSFPGTSMASPMVAGVAAVLRSYFPDMKAKEVKEVILGTVEPITFKVKVPGSEELAPLSDLCRTGGVVNSYKAVEKAMNVKYKKGKSQKDKVVLP